MPTGTITRVFEQRGFAYITPDRGDRDVYVHAESPDRYVLYELYADQAALDVHRFSAQLAKHRAQVDSLILSRRIWTQGEEMDIGNFPGRED